MKDPSGCCHVGGSVSKGEVVFCHYYSMGGLGTGVIEDCFPFLLCQSADVDGVAVEEFSVLVTGCYFL